MHFHRTLRQLSSAASSRAQPVSSMVADVLHSHTPTPSAADANLALVRSILATRSRVCILTGAGISTESGVPDYRSPGRPPHNPITHQQFMRFDAIRRRYWARSMIGYHRMTAAQPNTGHSAIARAQQMGRVASVITQNVDALHERAGARDVVHLHGDISLVECTQCRAVMSRTELQSQLEAQNPAFAQHVSDIISRATLKFEYEQRQAERIRSMDVDRAALAAASIPHVHDEDAPMSRHEAALRPDGDVELSNVEYYESFVIPTCQHCDGVLKPSVVFFGANVDPQTRQAADAAVAESDALVVVGTSLTTWSAFRLVKSAIERARNRLSSAPVTATALSAGFESIEAAASAPVFVAVINDGPTRADPLLPSELKIAARTGATLNKLFHQ